MKNTILTILCVLSIAGLAQASDNSFRFVMFSDTHFGNANYTNKHAQSVREILAMTAKPAAVFINGDITDHGLDSEIALFKSTIRDPLVAAGIPVYGVLGNHDGNNLGNSTVSQFCEKMGIPAYQSIDIQDTHFIITNGVPDNVQAAYGTKGGSSWGVGQAGQIDADQLVWLENDLQSQANTDAKLTIMMNHFPLYGQVQDGVTDGYTIQNTDWFGNVTNAGTNLKQWVDQYGVDVYLYGHRHSGQGANLRDSVTGALLAEIADTQGLGMQVFTPESTGNDNLFMQMLVDHSGSGTPYSYVNAQGATKVGAAGYDVFDVDGYTISHYRKIIDTYYGQQIGPQQQWTMTVAPEPVTSIMGDMNNDGTLDNLDISAFALALTDPATYQAQFPEVTDVNWRGDINGDASFDNLDIQPFANLLTSGTIPEPATMGLLLMGGLALIRRRRAA